MATFQIVRCSRAPEAWRVHPGILRVAARWLPPKQRPLRRGFSGSDREPNDLFWGNPWAIVYTLKLYGRAMIRLLQFLISTVAILCLGKKKTPSGFGSIQKYQFKYGVPLTLTVENSTRCVLQCHVINMNIHCGPYTSTNTTYIFHENR